jgi:putative ABC transport system permease protein
MNERMVRSVAVSPRFTMLVTIVIGNALCGLGGSLVAQQQQFSDVNMGLDTIIVGVTAVLLGELLCRGRSVIVHGVLAVVVGTLVYRCLIAYVLRLGVDPNYFNAITAGVVITAIFLSMSVNRTWARRLLPPVRRLGRLGRGVSA